LPLKSDKTSEKHTQISWDVSALGRHYIRHTVEHTLQESACPHRWVKDHHLIVSDAAAMTLPVP
jgi:hypothetical protein